VVVKPPAPESFRGCAAWNIYRGWKSNITTIIPTQSSNLLLESADLFNAKLG
jgi:hypothetical protein